MIQGGRSLGLLAAAVAFAGLLSADEGEEEATRFADGATNLAGERPGTPGAEPHVVLLAQVASPPPGVQAGAGRAYARGDYLGVQKCSGGPCHGNAEPRTEYDVLQSEVETWRTQDRHARSYTVLLEPDSVKIANNLKLDTSPEKSPRCLLCHALAPPAERKAVLFNVADGVSCESCHGPSGGWIDNHSKDGWSHQKSIDMGMTDLRDIALRARTCLRCHLGSEEGEVDHELLAAGHPELLFELDNFTSTMPPHWRSFQALKKREGRRETHGVRAWAVGQVEALRYGLEQLRRRARGPGWPEFAELTCTPCHHALKEERWRRIAGYQGRPGAPVWNLARWGLVEPILMTLAPDRLEAVRSEMTTISETVAALGQPTQGFDAAIQRAGEALEQASRVVDQAPLTSDVLRNLLDTVSRDPVARSLERQSAEQIFFGVNTLIRGLKANDKRVSAGLDRLYDNIGDYYEFDEARFREDLRSLREVLP